MSTINRTRCGSCNGAPPSTGAHTTRPAPARSALATAALLAVAVMGCAALEDTSALPPKHQCSVGTADGPMPMPMVEDEYNMPKHDGSGRAVIPTSTTPLRIEYRYIGFSSGNAAADHIKDTLMPAVDHILKGAFYSPDRTGSIQMRASCSAYMESVYGFALRTGSTTQVNDRDEPIESLPVDTTGAATDVDVLVFVFKSPNDWGSTVGRGGTCQADDSRPSIGHITFSEDSITSFKDSNPDYLVGVGVHEALHLLGMVGLDGGTHRLLRSIEYNGHTMYYFTGTEVVRRARLHFGCSTLVGLPMEDEGASVTNLGHWNARQMQEDIMRASGSVAERSLLSDMTLAFFEDMGYFTPNYAAAQPSRWGKDAGCGFFTARCNTAAGGLDKYFHFPAASQYQCTFDHHSNGFTRISTYTADLPLWGRYYTDPMKGGGARADYCPVAVPTTQSCTNSSRADAPATANSFGSQSRCYTSTEFVVINTYTGKGTLTRCMKSRCLSSTQLQFQLGDQTEWRSCPADGTAGTIQLQPFGYRGNIECPAASAICHDASLHVAGSQPDDGKGSDSGSGGGTGTPSAQPNGDSEPKDPNTGSNDAAGGTNSSQSGESPSGLNAKSGIGNLSVLEVILIGAGCGLLIIIIAAIFICIRCGRK